MRGAARFLIHLYPADWRARYGEEFKALLEDSAPSFSAIFDLMKGAIKMHLTVPSFPKLALLLSVAGMLAGWGISFLVTPTYISQATLQITPKQVSEGVDRTTINQELAERIGQMQQEILSRTSLSRMITDPRLDLYKDQRASQPLENVIETMRTRDIHITIDSLPGMRRASAFQISFQYPDRTKAHDTVQTLITKFQEANLGQQRALASVNQQRSRDQIDKMEARIAVLEKRLGIPPAPFEPLDQIARTSEGINLDVLDPPSLPVNPAKPSHYFFAFLGFGFGFIAALIVVIFRRPVHPAIPFPVQPA
jgi:LPS O-antigen subunit length determinant protein (WzzB/FepE family)